MSNSSYILERDTELFMLYHKARKENPELTNEQAIMKAYSSPPSRFYVSLVEVYREILNLQHGRPMSYRMKDIRRKQIEDIYKIYKELEAKPTFKGASPFFIVQFAIASPAPQFYLTYGRVRNIIFRMKREYEIVDE